MAKNDTSAAEPEAQTAEEAAEQQEQEESAAAKRERAKERAAEVKSYPADAEEPPTQKKVSGGETAYSVERLTTDARAFLGHPPHVVAGALYGVEKAYLTTDEAGKLVDEFLAREV